MKKLRTLGSLSSLVIASAVTACMVNSAPPAAPAAEPAPAPAAVASSNAALTQAPPAPAAAAPAPAAPAPAPAPAPKHPHMPDRLSTDGSQLECYAWAGA